MFLLSLLDDAARWLSATVFLVSLVGIVGMLPALLQDLRQRDEYPRLPV